MTNKTNDTEGYSWLTFEAIMGVVVIAGIFIFPYIAVSLIIGAFFIGILGPSSTRGTYWNSVGPARASNYENPYDRPSKR